MLLRSLKIITNYGHLRTLTTKTKVPSFGVAIDIDGVLMRGHVPLPNAKEALLQLHEKFPTVFVTNSLSRDSYKAYQIGSLFGLKFQSTQMVQAQGPLAMYKEFHNKRCLLVGQGPLAGIASDIGFTTTQWMDDIALGYPLLNVVDHQTRYEVSSGDVSDFNLPRTEAVILLGEPKNWEMCLQLLIDILLTEGHPTQTAKRFNHQTIPVIVCNVDLLFMHRSSFPRFGHGAFVLCLEQLFKKITGHDLKYTAVLGKPSEVTFRYAEHCLAQEAQRMGIEISLQTMYMIGDNIDVDIVGSNLYKRYISDTSSNIPDSRKPPQHTDNSLNLLPQTVTSINSVLVKTGVSTEDSDCSSTSHSHREFTDEKELRKPTATVDDILQAVEYVLLEEGYL